MKNADYLVFQAKSFYNAYIALEQIGQACEDKMLYSVPMIVNGAFSIELTLKAILAKNSIEYRKEHNLYTLFESLPEEFRVETLEHLIIKAPEYADVDKCFNELILISNAFVDWRYSFEEKPAPAFDLRFLSAFANAAIWTMFSHYNADITPAIRNDKSVEEIEELIRKNREQCINRNLTMIKKNSQEHNS